MGLDFSNTEVAFRGKNNKELKKAYWLFKMVSSPGLVRFGKWSVDFAFKLRLPVTGLIKKTIFSQFCGGEDIKECSKTIKDLEKHGIGTILDYSLEGKTTDEDLDATMQEVIDTIERAKADDAIPFSVFKPTGISKFSTLENSNTSIDELNPSESKDYQRFVERMAQICQSAHKLSVPVFVDAEDSWIQDTIDRETENMMWQFNKESAIVYTTIQMYRWDRLDYLKSLHKKAKEKGVRVGVKLVRGAYMEKERARAQEKGYKDPIQPNKESTDRDYNLALEYCMSNLDVFSICAGSHNEESAMILSELLQEHQISNEDKRVYFAQLLGMSDHISYNLSSAGYNVAKYVPYGPVKEVMPYLIRRAQENTSVAGQTGRELSLIKEERKRRIKD